VLWILPQHASDHAFAAPGTYSAKSSNSEPLVILWFYHVVSIFHSQSENKMCASGDLHVWEKFQIFPRSPISKQHIAGVETT
jgi:hypothetical protein